MIMPYSNVDVPNSNIAHLHGMCLGVDQRTHTKKRRHVLRRDQTTCSKSAN